MKYLLDTDICIYCLNGRRPLVTRRVNVIPRHEIAVSTVTKGKLFAGSANSTQRQRTRERQEAFLVRYTSLPFDDAAADEYGRIDGLLRRRGMRIDPLDTQIAAIALVHNLTLVTHNTRHFRRVPNLTIEDWTNA
ncbi:MAG: type II toxin-antitoxin system VapC family toxin [Chloroflexota bacterium]|nr:type II toxin-antitoxin system VapC family toxin [Chloroflexota bacterium]